MDVYMARQPIFDKNKSVIGYELLFRDGIHACFPKVDTNVATCSVLSQGFLSMDFEKVFQQHKVFINFPDDLLLNRIPLLFPKDHLVIEVLETVHITDALADALQDLASQGYMLALDDFIDDPQWNRFFPWIGIIKIDIRTTPLDRIPEIQSRIGSYPIRLLAEKVETIEEFQQTLDLGFDYFQGYFFCKPETIKTRDIAPLRLPLIQLMAEILKDEIRFDELERIIAHDVSISYKLLRYINSAYFFRGKEISSIRQALLRLGDAGIRRFIPILAMSHVAAGKPSELIRTGVIRAKFCEMLASELAGAGFLAKRKIPEWFLMGLFSVIDGIMDEPMQMVLSRIALSSAIRDALLGKRGPMSNGLSLIKAYEAGVWNETFDLASRLDINLDDLPRTYWNAVTWADEFTEGL